MKPSDMHATGLVAVILSMGGFIDSMYLSIARIMGVPLSCGLQGGCNVVSASPYSLLLGIPLAYWGVGFYLAAFAASWWYWKERSSQSAQALFVIALAGALASVYFVYIQAFVIEAFCIYCLISAAVSVGLLITGILALRKAPSKNSIDSTTGL